MRKPMRKYFFVFLSVFLFLPISSFPVYAVDINIKLRKTDINELKQQIMPVFEQNIQLLTKLLNCLEQGKNIDFCLEQYDVMPDTENGAASKERNEQIKQNIKNKINDNNIQQDQIVFELKKLLAEAEDVKQCLYQGQTANDLKDCAIKYK